MVLTRHSRRKPATDERTGSVEATLPSGYSRHHEGAGSQMRQQRAGYRTSGKFCNAFGKFCNVSGKFCNVSGKFCNAFGKFCNVNIS